MNKSKKWLGMFLAVAIFFSAFCYIPIAKAVSNTIAESEEATFSTATIRDDFADNRIIVILSEAASKRRAV